MTCCRNNNTNKLQTRYTLGLHKVVERVGGLAVPLADRPLGGLYALEAQRQQRVAQVRIQNEQLLGQRALGTSRLAQTDVLHPVIETVEWTNGQTNVMIGKIKMKESGHWTEIMTEWKKSGTTKSVRFPDAKFSKEVDFHHAREKKVLALPLVQQRELGLAFEEMRHAGTRHGVVIVGIDLTVLDNLEIVCTSIALRSASQVDKLFGERVLDHLVNEGEWRTEVRVIL